MEPEPYIPLRVTDLIDVLLHEAGTPEHPRLAQDQHDEFRQLASELAKRIESNYRGLLKLLKDAYAPFDPDAETMRLTEAIDDDSREKLNRLFASASMMLKRGGFHRMTRDEIESTMQGASHWGIEMDVCWDVFERVEVFYRGKGIGFRTRRPWWRFFRTQELMVPTFRRVVMVLKQKPHKRLDKHADTKHVFMKLFKDIPMMDIEMLLPGTRLRMPKLERGKLGSTAVGSLAWLGFKLAPFFSTFSISAMLSGSLLTLFMPLFLILGYSYKTIVSFRVSKKSYLLQLTQSLYFQGLDTNAGVLYRLFDEAAEQNIRQTLFAWFFLWRFSGSKGWTADELDKAVEADLEKRVSTRVEVDTVDALSRLERLNMIRRIGDRYVAQPVGEAINALKTLSPRNADSRWQGEVTTS